MTRDEVLAKPWWTTTDVAVYLDKTITATRQLMRRAKVKRSKVDRTLTCRDWVDKAIGRWCSDQRPGTQDAMIATETPKPGSHHSIVRCIDDTLAVLVARLKAKQPMYHPDAEWNALMQTCESLRASKRDIARYVAPNDPSSATSAR